MKKIIILYCLLFTSSQGFAWGPEGHRIVAQIAEDNLTQEAKNGVKKLLGDLSLAQVANWADTVKGQKEWSHTRPWHFVDIADSETYETAPHAPEGDSITAITQLVNELKNPKSTEITKQNALKFIVHFVGDLHQPLHVGRPTDRGGNDIKVIFEGKQKNLHSVWDSGMITHQQMSYLQYVNSLAVQSFLVPSYDISEISFSQIIAEAMGARMSIYNFKQTSPNSPAVLDEKYLKQNVPTVNERLIMGGKRLATLINSIFRTTPL